MRKFIKRFLLVLNISLLIVYLIGCLLPWLSPNYFWLLAFIGFAFPYIAIALLLTTLFWLMIKPKYSLYILLFFLCGTKQLNAVFAINKNTTFNITKPNNSIRVVSWNIGNLSAKAGFKNAIRYTTQEVIKELLNQNADVICIQEFTDDRERLSSEFLQLTAKYKNYYFPHWNIGPHRHRGGNLILSKLPIVFKDSLVYEVGENILRADIICYEDTISFFTTHLDSYKFSKEQLKEINPNDLKEKPSKQRWKSIFKKVRDQTQTHTQQATAVNNFIAKSKHPFVFCGDLNEVPNNYVYWQLRENKQDAFLKKGFGFGKSFNTLSAILRIDYILPNNNFEVHQFKLVEKGLSDHAMLVADIELKK